MTVDSLEDMLDQVRREKRSLEEEYVRTKKSKDQLSLELENIYEKLRNLKEEEQSIEKVMENFDGSAPAKVPAALDIKVKYHEPITKLKNIGGEKSDWIDLRCAEDVYLRDGEFALLSLGVSIELPEGYEAIVAPRSSTFKNFGILMANSIGIIDETYCGDDDVWRFPAFAIRDTHIPFDSRIAQFRIIRHQPETSFITVSQMSNNNRGGIGSTGTR